MCDKASAAVEKGRQVKKWAGGVAINQIDKQVGQRLKTGVCIGCGRAISTKRPNGEEDAIYHDKCAGKAKKEVTQWVSASKINLTNQDKYGRNKLGVRYFGCGCNANNIVHSKHCKWSGPISDKLKEGLE